MTSGQLPKVRDLSPRTSQGIMLGRIGALLREQYRDLLSKPVPEQLAALVRKLT